MQKINILIAGTGNPHIPAYLRGSGRDVSGLNIVAVSDADAGRLERAGEMLGDDSARVRFYRDHREMFAAHPDADAVIIGSDNIDHLRMFEDAVFHNFHIFMMKVISMDERECRRMLELVKSYDRVVQCELELHFHPQFRAARELVRSDRLGEIKSIYLSNISQSPCNYFPNWGDPVLSYGKKIPIRPGADYYRGGALTDHPHAFDMVRWITGAEFDTVRALSALNQRSHLEVEDHVAVMGRLDNGVKYFINPSYSNLEERVATRRLLWPKSLECNLKITGTAGYYSCDFFDHHCYIIGSNYVSANRLIVDSTPRPKPDQDDSIIGSFIACIHKRREHPESALADSYAAVRVMNAAYESIYHNCEITLEPLR